MSAVDYRSAFADYVTRGESRGLVKVPLSDTSTELVRSTLRGTRALGIANPTAGGYLAPPSFERAFKFALAAHSAAWALFSRLETPTGAELGVPTVNDTGSTATIAVEGQARPTPVDPSFGLAISNPFLFSTGVVRLSMEALQDSDLVEPVIAGLLAERLASGIDRVSWVGTGVGEPRGLTLAASNVVAGGTGTATSIPWSDLQSMVTTVNAAYRYTPEGSVTSRWVMNDSTYQHVTGLVDGNGRSQWVPDPKGESPGALLGFPITISDHMSPLAANARSVLFGDFQRAALLRVVDGVVLHRLNELYATSGQVGLLAELRGDTVMTDTRAFAAYQHGAS